MGNMAKNNRLGSVGIIVAYNTNAFSKNLWRQARGGFFGNYCYSTPNSHASLCQTLKVNNKIKS